MYDARKQGESVCKNTDFYGLLGSEMCLLCMTC